MDTATYRAYTITDESPQQALLRYAQRTGRLPETAVAHQGEQDRVRAALPPTVAVETAAHGGPHPGEIWLA